MIVNTGELLNTNSVAVEEHEPVTCALLSKRTDSGFVPVHDCLLVQHGLETAAFEVFARLSDALGYPLAVELKRA